MKFDWKNKILIFVTILLIILAMVFFSIYKEKAKVDRYIHEIFTESITQGVDGSLILAIIKTESNFDKNAVSHKNAFGLMQLLEKTAEPIALDKGYIFNKHLLFDPKVNIELGTIYFKYLIEKFGNVDTAIVAYNAGEGNVSKWLVDKNHSTDGKTLFHIPFSESEKYYHKVIKFRDNYAKYYERYVLKQLST